jgi:hypothetical protein
LIEPKLGGNRFPSSRSKAGFGSNISIWLGPPTMNKKMHRFAFGAKWGPIGTLDVTDDA